jgi:hypothetical protein
VIVHSYTGTLRLKHLPDSQLVLALIEERMARQRKQQQRSERQSIEQTLRLQMGQSQGADTNSQTVVQEAKIQSKPGLLKTFWDETFSMCFQQDDVITYRKHWWILVAYIWKQTLLLMFILAAFIALLLGHLTFLTPTFLGILLCLAALFIFGWWVYKFVDWQNDQFLITSEQVIDIDKKPLGREERRAAPLKSIQSIEYQRIGFIGLLLNFGTVFIRIGDTEFTFDFVSNPSEVQRELFQRLTDYQNRQKKEAIDAENQRMAEWIQIYHNLSNNHSVDKPDTEDWL